MSEIKTPKRLRGQSPAHNYAPKQEREAAKIIRGRTTPGSGSGYQGADARHRGLVRVECKSTTAKSFSVTTATIDNLEAATFGSGEIPVIQVDMLKKTGKLDRRVYIGPAWARDGLLGRLTRDSTS